MDMKHVIIAGTWTGIYTCSEFSLYYTCRHDHLLNIKARGGTALLVHYSVPSQLIAKNTHLQAIAIAANILKSHILHVHLVYIPPDKNFSVL